MKAVLYDSKMSQSNIDEKNDFGETPLHIAAKWGFRECFVFMVYEKIIYNCYRIVIECLDPWPNRT